MSNRCFRPPGIPPNPPNLTTSLYHTQSALFGLTWSRDLLGRSLHIHIHLHYLNPNLNNHSNHPSFHLQIRPWKKRGSQRLLLPPPAAAAHVYWDLSKAKFGSGPAPASGFYVAIMIDGEMKLLVDGAKAQATLPGKVMKEEASMVLRREHVYVRNKVMLYNTKLVDFGKGREREISIDCRVGGHGAEEEESRLYLSVDSKRVLEIKHLKWKFRGNERIQVDDGMPIQVSWDVHSWLFPQKQHVDKDHDQEVVESGDHHGSSSYALFMFKFEKYPSSTSSILGPGLQEEEEQQQRRRACGFGFENEKMNKGKGLKMMKSGRLMSSNNHWSSSSSTSSCLSSASSGCSSVMEWESVEENELKDPCGFSLLVYAWRS